MNLAWVRQETILIMGKLIYISSIDVIINQKEKRLLASKSGNLCLLYLIHIQELKVAQSSFFPIRVHKKSSKKVNKCVLIFIPYVLLHSVFHQVDHKG